MLGRTPTALTLISFLRARIALALWAKSFLIENTRAGCGGTGPDSLSPAVARTRAKAA